MKTLNLLIISAVFFSASIFGQDSGLPGEDFDLEALLLPETKSTQLSVS